MATPIQTANVSRFAWRRPRLFHHAPRALLWAIGLGLLWAVVRPPLTLLAGMSRWQPPGSEHLYLAGVGIGIAIDLAVYGFLSLFLLRRERWAQSLLIGASLVQALYWGMRLVQSPHTAVAIPANFPAFASPPPVGRDAMYAISAVLSLLPAVAAMFPSVWAWTRRERARTVATA